MENLDDTFITKVNKKTDCDTYILYAESSEPSFILSGGNSKDINTPRLANDEERVWLLACIEEGCFILRKEVVTKTKEPYEIY